MRMNATILSVENYYHIIIPLSLTFILIAIIIALIILSLVIFIKRLHTVTYLLVCNGAIASIFYCIIQCINYIFLAFISWETSDLSCRWRGYFGYMGVVAVVYAYFAQAISRFFISILSIKYHWANSFIIHRILIFIQWILVIFLPLPALLTEDINHRPLSLCWVPKEYIGHLIYIIMAYYFIPALFIFAIYIYIYLQVKRSKNRIRNHRTHRDLELLGNIMILFAIYIFGALPSLIHMIARIEIFYPIGLIFVSFAVAIEKLMTLLIDRDFRNIIKTYLRRSMSQIRPIT